MQTTEPPESKAPATIRALLTGEEFKHQVTLALPRHISPDRFVRVALTAMTRTPKLQECDKHSFFNALLTLSQLGLEPDGRLAHLIPFNNSKRNCVECQLIVDYKGLVDLAMRSGNVANIHADKVCANDVFEYNVGEVVAHKIDFRKDRGAAYCYFAQVTFKDGTKKADVMTLAEVQAIQKRSRAGSSGPWVTDFHEMAKKTVFRRLSKWLPLSPEYRDALDADADTLEERRLAAAIPAMASTIPNFATEDEPAEATETQAGGGSEGKEPGDPPAAQGLQTDLAQALSDLDFKQERFVAGLRLLEVKGIAKQAKVVADLSDAVCETVFAEGLDGVIAAIEGRETK